MCSKIYKTLLLAVVILLLNQNIFGQNRFFSEVATIDQPAMRVSNELGYLIRYKLYKIDIDALRNYLLTAPKEFSGNNTSERKLEIPMPNGTSETFAIFESPMLSPAVAAKHPEIKTYSGKGVTHESIYIRVNLTSEGFSGIILGTPDGAVYFEKLKSSDGSTYKSYFSKDAIHPSKKGIQQFSSKCGTLTKEMPANILKKVNGLSGTLSAKFTNGTQLKTFRLAMAADAEFTARKGGSQSAAFAALTNYVNNLNAVFRHELSVALQLVSDQTLVYTNAATDPYTNDDQIKMLDENQANLNAVLGNTNYDIGHVLGATAGSGGGVAMSPSVCDGSYKGQGVSGVGDGSFPEVFDFQLIAHEVGHQFGMSHSYNSNVPVCTTREHTTSVEPGSGTTIMSYGYTCTNTDAGNGLVGNDDYESSYSPFLNFHVVSLTQALNYIGTLSCFTTSATGNAIPAINSMPTSYTIPKSTPFVLTGTATDGNAADDLTYSWEGTNISDESDNNNLTATVISDDTKPPFFRSYPPVASSVSSNPGRRYYPRLSAILDGTNTAIGDKLPSIGIATTHTLTVRDNNGGVATEDVTVSIDGSSGPFLVTNDPTGTHTGNSSLTVEWSVNGTTAAPVNCTLVDILLSTDGGATFSSVLASAVANSGNASVTLPNVNTSQARIKVMPSISTASGNNPNIFFDISNQNFSINSTLPVSWLSFDVVPKDETGVSLVWKTDREINNAGFEIEISGDGQSFVKLGYVNGKGSASGVQQYQYAVKELAAGIYYFRLKQVDLDGKSTYSEVRRVVIANSFEHASIYPNPATGNVKINPGQHHDNVYSIKVFDQAGRIVLHYPANRYTTGFELKTIHLSRGVYHIVLKGNSFMETLKLIKM